MSSLKLEEGKFYRNRRGEKVGPVRRRRGECTFPWHLDDSLITWLGDGHVYLGDVTAKDLVAEWVDEASDTYSAGPEDDLSNDEVIYCTPPCVYGSDTCKICPPRDPSDLAMADAINEWAGSDGAISGVVTFSDPQPERVKILRDGAALTNGDRDEEYGPPANNMSCAGELKAVFRKWLARDIGPGELEALDMAMTKLSRLSCGKPKRDTYVDAATYIAIAGEIALTPTA